MHLGNARSALLAWLFARASSRRIILRVEDLDPNRCRPAYERDLIDDLRWLGLDWDEGPDIGGPRGPYRQSERAEHYEAAIAKLDTFACTCTRKELRMAVPQGQEPVYPGTCRAGPSHPERPAALRWRVPPEMVVAHDRYAPPLSHDLTRDVGDVLIRRSDGAYAYQLAVVVDDAAMGVDQVVRGMDLWTSTPRQIALLRTLGAPVPQYVHLPLIRGADGGKLSKRDGAPDLGELRAAGTDPTRLTASLARSVGLTRAVRATPAQLLESFAPDRLEFDGPAMDWAALARPE